MIYELAHLIKKKFSFLWDIIEWMNSTLFFLMYRKKLEKLDRILQEEKHSCYEMRTANKKDIPALLAFFKRQPQEAFLFFKPHPFDEKGIKRVVANKSFLTFILTEQHEIIGYAFMRSFVNRSTYRGYMIDAEHRGRGLAKIMGLGMNRVGDALALNMYKSISPENIASIKVTQAVCETEILKRLNNGDYLIKCLSKEMNNVNKSLTGGVNSHQE